MSTERERLGWIDAARGIGIVLVVLGHVIIGLVDAGLAERSSLLWRWCQVVYTFHMPLFFFLSGLFVPQSVERGSRVMGQGLWWRIVWPYLLWSTVQLAVMSAASGSLNHEARFDAERWVAIAWQPVSQFWFLHTLALFQLAAWLLLPRVGPRGLLWLALALLMVPAWVSLPPVLANPCRFAVFFALGTFGPQASARSLRPAPGYVLALASVAAIGLCTLIGLELQARELIPWSSQALPAAFLGVAGCLGVAKLLAGADTLSGLAAWAQRASAALGRSSMAIFVLHIMFASGTRILLHRWAHVGELALLFGACLFMGLAGPLLVERGVRQVGALRALGLGR